MAIPYVAGGGGAAQLLCDVLTVMPWDLLAVLGYYPAWDVDERLIGMVRLMVLYLMIYMFQWMENHVASMVASMASKLLAIFPPVSGILLYYYSDHSRCWSQVSKMNEKVLAGFSTRKVI